MSDIKTAAVLLIGDELLSGRTRDINLKNIAEFLAPLGIQVREARIVPDIQEKIVEALNALRAEYSYVFTTGGIGPTHDDITADAVAAAFGDHIDVRQDALAIIQKRYEETGVELTPARLRMARIPDSAKLVANPVSGAPGFQIDNVFVMAGVPSIARAMLEDIEPRLETGQVIKTAHVRGVGLREGDLAGALADIAEKHATLSIGSYPWYGSPTDSGVNIVVRGADEEEIQTAIVDVSALVRAQGVEPEVHDIS
ncbi:competence/damage-inducible protein A [Ponticaulis profundi]|uniref:Competence/damage-inducible protein A n=1 Tax=Ponticaulis profundi TaxID=2665222 RepID=A0ABW1SB10_9PROT